MGMQQKHQQHHGFTIVELLIVIIVIALLAAITLIGYNAVRIRSENTRTIANIRQYVSAIRMYNIKTGTYPITPSESGKSVAMVCLGIGYKDGYCGRISSINTYESSSFMDDLQAKSGVSLSAIVSDRYGDVGGENFIGAAYGVDITDSEHSSTLYARTIQWHLTGENQDCILAGAWAYRTEDGNTACEIDFEEVQ